MIDTATTLTELIRIDNKMSRHVAAKTEECWLSRYPRLLYCIHHPGTEFTGSSFQMAMLSLGIKAVPTTTKNPQANTICEQVHKTVDDMLWTYLNVHPLDIVEKALKLADSVLSSVQQGLHMTVHRTLGVSQGVSVFQRDMLLNVLLIADYQLICANRQAVINENANRANLHRRFKDYRVGDKVLVLQFKPSTMQPQAIGPFPIIAAHVNGTVTIGHTAATRERINICRIRPYYDRNNGLQRML